MTAMATTATTLAVLGPIGAGRIADVSGSYAPAMLIFSMLLLAATGIASLFLRAPKENEEAAAVSENGEEVGDLVPAE